MSRIPITLPKFGKDMHLISRKSSLVCPCRGCALPGSGPAPDTGAGTTSSSLAYCISLTLTYLGQGLLLEGRQREAPDQAV